MMTFPTEWKNKIHVPNHQPVISFGFLEMLELSQNLDGFVQSATGWK
jgi:predicted N-acyltransferase